MPNSTVAASWHLPVLKYLQKVIWNSLKLVSQVLCKMQKIIYLNKKLPTSETGQFLDFSWQFAITKLFRIIQTYNCLKKVVSQIQVLWVINSFLACFVICWTNDHILHTIDLNSKTKSNQWNKIFEIISILPMV